VTKISILSTALPLLALSGPAWAQPVSEQVEGVQRICRYESNPYVSTTDPGPSWIVGVGESCPFTYPGGVVSTMNSQAVQRDTAAPTPRVPSMATLVGERRDGLRITCVYTYLDREYLRPGRIDSRCPLTPN
jgi:hypothetical protein